MPAGRDRQNFRPSLYQLLEVLDKELIDERAYHTWPLFKVFRTSPEFLKAYEEIYGRPFIVELQKATNQGQSSSGGDKRKK